MTDQPVPPQRGAAPRPSSPLQLELPDWKATLRRTLQEFKQDRASMIAAGMAYYWFLAIFPALMAAVGIFGLVNAGPDAKSSLTKAVRSTLPGDAAEVLSGALDRAPSGGASIVAVVVGLALALWSASAGMVAMQSGLNVAYDIPEDRPFVKKRTVALALIAVSAVLGGVATVLVVFGQPLGDTIRDDVPFGGAFILVWTVLRWALAIGAVIVLFASFYYLGPNRPHPRWTWLSPGGLVGVVVWLAASLGFSLYVSSFGSYAKTYGSLAGVVVLILWLYLSALAVVLGAELNAELERQSAVRRGQLEHAEEGSTEPSPEPSAEPSGAGTAAPQAEPPEVTAARTPASADTEGAWSERMRQLRQR